MTLYVPRLGFAKALEDALLYASTDPQWFLTDVFHPSGHLIALHTAIGEGG